MSAPPDGPPLDPRRLLGTLNRHHVDYLVGGIAAQAHGVSSTPYDIDCHRLAFTGGATGP